MNLFLFFSLSSDLQWPQTNKQTKILNYIFKQSKGRTKKKYVKIEGEKEAIHGEKDVENWQFI